MNSLTNSSLRLVALVAGVAVALALMGAVAVAPAQAAGLTQTQIQSIVSLLASFGADAATINNVTAALNGQATSGTGGSTGGSTGGACPALSRDLQQGSSGADVKALQVYLNSMADTQVAVSGAGAPGLETTTFGPATNAAVMKLQTKLGVTPVAGYVGAKTRAAIAATCASGSTGGNTGGTTGGAVTVNAAAQPVNSLAPSGATRVPFTAFTVSNNSSAAVTVNSVTVQRVGLGVDANFSGIVLLDQNGLQTGTAKTLNSNHQANLDGFTLAAGSSMTFTVAGNIADQNTAQSGQVVALQVVAINTGATVSGSLPINGASQTINTTLTLGSVSTSTSSYDPGTAQNKSIGSTGVRFSGLRFTAGSAEDVKLYNIRWRQTGTAASSDVANVMTVVNGASYPANVDSTGKYYTTIFPGGLLVPKGNSVDVYVQGDLIGSNSATRTLQFNIDKVTDVYFVGQTYGFGVAPTGNNQPWFTGFVTNIQGGTASVIQNATSVASGNVPVNVNNTILGGFQTNFLGEAVSVSGLTFSVSTSSVNYGVLTSVSIVDGNGVVVAGPVDQAAGSASLVFGDTVTFPVGLQTYTVKGKVSSNAQNGQTIQITTTADSTNWRNAVGQTSGNTIGLPGSVVSMNTQTVKGATLTVSASPNPVSQSVVAGNAIELANIQLDASQSGEDIRLNSLPLYIITGIASSLNTCQLWNGSTAVNTGTNVVNAAQVNTAGGTVSSPTGSATTFTFDNSLVVTKGSQLTLKLTCNIASGANGSVAVAVNTTAAPSVLGVQSGNSVTTSNGLTVNATGGGIQTVSGNGGNVAVSVDSSSPSRTLVAAGTTGVNLGVVKFHPTSENVNLTKVGLTIYGGNTLSTGNGASTNAGVNDVTQVYIYNGATLVGTAFFTGTNTTATSTFNTPLTLTKDTDTLLTIRGDMAQIGVSSAGGIGDYVRVSPNSSEGIGASSGQTVKTGSTGTTNGVQLYKSYPTVALGPNAASNPNGQAQVLKRFSVTANAAGSIGLDRMRLTIATSSASVTNIKLFAYNSSDYASNAVSNQSSGTGQVGGNVAATSTGGTLVYDVANSGGNPIQISAGQTVYFALLGDVAPASNQTNWTITATLLGDSATTTAVAGYNSAQAASASGNFIWSDNATTTAAITDIDWANAFQVPGLSSNGI